MYAFCERPRICRPLYRRPTTPVGQSARQRRDRPSVASCGACRERSWKQSPGRMRANRFPTQRRRFEWNTIKSF